MMGKTAILLISENQDIEFENDVRTPRKSKKASYDALGGLNNKMMTTTTMNGGGIDCSECASRRATMTMTGGGDGDGSDDGGHDGGDDDDACHVAAIPQSFM